eukprot:3770230-Pleurochrysis_carterae.AAC.3
MRTIPWLTRRGACCDDLLGRSGGSTAGAYTACKDGLFDECDIWPFVGHWALGWTRRDIQAAAAMVQVNGK